MNLRTKIAHVLNEHSAENGSDTPDFILADYLMDCLCAFDRAANRRGDWRSRASIYPAQEEPDQMTVARRGVKGKIYPCKPDVFEATLREFSASRIRRGRIMAKNPKETELTENKPQGTETDPKPKGEETQPDSATSKT